MVQNGRIAEVSLGGQGAGQASPEAEQEWRVAVFDLQEKGGFDIEGVGPFHLVLSIDDRAISFEIKDLNGDLLRRSQLGLGAVRNAVRDYTEVCDAYYGAVRSLPPARIEVIDKARKEVHDQGGRIVMDELSADLGLTAATARSLFSLICTLRIGD